LVRELNGRRIVAILACLLIAISPFHILFSHELRMYTMLMFLVTLGTYTYLRAVREDRWFWWLIFAAVFAAAIFTHVFAWLALLALGIYTIVRFRKSPITAKFIVISTILVIIFLPWLSQMVSEQQRELGSLRPLDQEVDNNPIKLLTSMSFLLFGMASQPFLVGLSLFLLLSIGILLILETIKVRRNSEYVWSFLPILMLITLVIVPVFVYMIRPFFLPERTMAAASPFLIILLAWGATRSRTPLPYLTVIAVALMLVNAIIYIVGEPIKPPYREASEFVDERLQPGDQVLHTSDGSYLPWLRYTNNDNHALLIGDPDPRKPDSIYRVLGGTQISRAKSFEDGTRLWLIVALEHSQEWQKEQVAYFVDRYHRIEQFNVGGIDILLFEHSG
jgi:mannosyltransferase